MSESLSLAITETFTLDSFEITSVLVKPRQSASVNISIKGSNGKNYERIAYFEGDVYDGWKSDDYLYNYIQQNIKTIFN